MRNLKESDIMDYIQEQYDPRVMPKIYFKELHILQDYTDGELILTAKEHVKLGCYICPTDENKLNVFIPGQSAHYSVPAEVFLKYSDSYEIGEFLRSERKSRNATIFNIGNYEYTLIPNFNRYREFVRTDYLCKEYMLKIAAEEFKDSNAVYVCVPRIYGKDQNSSLFWELKIKGRGASKFFKIFGGVKSTYTYPQADTQITIGANSKTVFWKGVGCWMRKGKLYLKMV